MKASHEYYPHQEDIFEVSTVAYDTYIAKWPWTTPYFCQRFTVKTSVYETPTHGQHMYTGLFLIYSQELMVDGIKMTNIWWNTLKKTKPLSLSSAANYTGKSGRQDCTENSTYKKKNKKKNTKNPTKEMLAHWRECTSIAISLLHILHISARFVCQVVVHRGLTQVTELQNNSVEQNQPPTYPVIFCDLRFWYSTSSTVHTAPLTFSTRTKHLCRLRLWRTAF